MKVFTGTTFDHTYSYGLSGVYGTQVPLQIYVTELNSEQPYSRQVIQTFVQLTVHLLVIVLRGIRQHVEDPQTWAQVAARMPHRVSTMTHGRYNASACAPSLQTNYTVVSPHYSVSLQMDLYTWD